LLPVLAGHDRMQVVALVDRDVDRARGLATSYGIERVLDDVAALSRAEVDAVVLATPPAHHAPATIALVGQGFHVMVEKPMAVTSADAEAMVAAADASGVVLSVGLYRRLLPVSRLLCTLLETEFLGRPLSVDIEEGGEYSWKLASLAPLTRAGGGGGVLIDIGSHLLDQLRFVLPGESRLVRYRDNARGGIETDCELELDIASRFGNVPARVELSRTRDLRGSLRVACERGTIEILRGDFCRLRVQPDIGATRDVIADTPRSVEFAAEWSDEPSLVGYKAFRREFDDWLDAIKSGRPPQLSGASVVPTVRLIEACYATPEPLPEPWTDRTLPLAGSAAATARASTKPKVLVTGAGGFLGCRTVELLHADGRWDVRAMVRRPGSAARLARLPVEIVIGDVVSRTDVDRAIQECDAVVHCAVGTGWPPETVFKTTVEGTRNVADASHAAGARLVHLSSMAVHGDSVPARLDETVPLDPGSGMSYSRAKYLAEQTVSALVAKGLKAVVLRPARIYGPFSKTFTVRPFSALMSGVLVLAGDADTPANMVYVDNVVEAIVRALDSQAATLGEAYLISEHDQLSWRDYYAFFASAAGKNLRVEPYPSKTNGSGPSALRRWVEGGKQIAFSPEVRALAKKVMWTDPYGVLPRRLWERSPGLQRSVLRTLGVDEATIYREPEPRAPFEVRFRIDPTTVVFDKATRELGYNGTVRRPEAMQLTLEWARYARILTP
jgi:predicted dehydrogenase/nucleoside-diphosphate-sugar epimerase